MKLNDIGFPIWNLSICTIYNLGTLNDVEKGDEGPGGEKEKE